MASRASAFNNENRFILHCLLLHIIIYSDCDKGEYHTPKNPILDHTAKVKEGSENSFENILSISSRMQSRRGIPNPKAFFVLLSVK
jgi:hypothetical protein